MTNINYNEMNLDQLRQYVLTHREDLQAFQHYIDRSKSSGRMITVNTNDQEWEDNLNQKIKQSISNHQN
jgi:hypothetical protein